MGHDDGGDHKDNGTSFALRRWRALDSRLWRGVLSMMLVQIVSFQV